MKKSQRMAIRCVSTVTSSMAWVFVALVISLCSSAEAEESLFTVGAVADVQYADSAPRGQRTPRETPRRLQVAVDSFNAHEVDFAISLGDLIDWDDIVYSTFLTTNQVLDPVDWTHFTTIDAIWQKVRAPHYYVLGNHAWCVPDKAHDGEKPWRVYKRFGFKDKTYHDFSHKGYRFILLDGTDRYMYAYPKGSYAYRDAKAYMESFRGTSRCNAWNGAISPKQLDWFKKTLADAAVKQEKVVVCCHFPVHDPTDNHSLINCEDVTEVLEGFPNVVLWLNGHDHQGGYALMNEGQANQCHHLNLSGMQNKDDRYYRLTFFKDRIEVYRAEQNTPEHILDVAAVGVLGK